MIVLLSFAWARSKQKLYCILYTRANVGKYRMVGSSEVRDQPIMLIFYLLCYAAVLNILTYYAQYYAHVKDLCLKSDCSIRVYSLVLLEYTSSTHYSSTNNNMMNVLLEYVDLL